MFLIDRKRWSTSRFWIPFFIIILISDILFGVGLKVSIELSIFLICSWARFDVSRYVNLQFVLIRLSLLAISLKILGALFSWALCLASDIMSNIVQSSSVDSGGNLFDIVLNPAPLTPLMLSDGSPHIDFARQKLFGLIPNFSTTSFLLTNYFQVGE